MEISKIMKSYVKLLTLFILLSTLVLEVSGSTVGVCYGRVADNLPLPAEVLNLLQVNNVDKVHIYDSNTDVLSAFQGSNIKLIISVANQDLQLFAQSQTAANTWVQNNVVPYNSVIKYISVGNEVLHESPGSVDLYGAMENIWLALESAGLSESIKVSTAHAYDVVQGYPPSSGSFNNQIQPTMNQILSFLKRTNAPFFINIYTYFSYIANVDKINLKYALLESDAPENTDDKPYIYTNLFDAMVDTVVAALSAAGYADLDIHVTETGWPSAGDTYATVSYAETYNNNLRNHVSNGTPRRPNQLIQTYIFALFNENKKTGLDTEQHFGIFYPDETMVYSFTF